MFLTKNKKINQLKVKYLDILGPFFLKKSDYYKLIRVGNFWNNNYIEYESRGNRNKTYQ